MDSAYTVHCSRLCIYLLAQSTVLQVKYCIAVYTVDTDRAYTVYCFRLRIYLLAQSSVLKVKYCIAQCTLWTLIVH